MEQVGLRRRLLQLIASLIDCAASMAERRKSLQHADTLDVVDDDAVQPTQFVAISHERGISGAPKGEQKQQDQHERRQRDQRKLPVDEQHHDAD